MVVTFMSAFEWQKVFHVRCDTLFFGKFNFCFVDEKKGIEWKGRSSYFKANSALRKEIH